MSPPQKLLTWECIAQRGEGANAISVKKEENNKMAHHDDDLKMIHHQDDPNITSI